MANQNNYLGEFDDDIFDRFEYGLKWAADKLRKSSIQPNYYALVGGEPSFWSVDVQSKFMTLMDKYYKHWIVFTNGYDMKAPILNRLDWNYVLHIVSPETLKENNLDNLPDNWSMMTVDGSMKYDGICNPKLRLYIDSNLYRDYDLEQAKKKLLEFGTSHFEVLEARKNCYLNYKILRIDVVHMNVYPCCKSAECIPLDKFEFWKKPLCNDCVPFLVDWKPLWSL